MPEDPRIARSICLRFATQPSQGRGWSVYQNEHWVNPAPNIGTMVIRDDANIPRSLVLDRNDNQWYELATFDRVAYSRPPYADKIAVQDAEIPTEKWVREETVSQAEQHKRLEDGMSHLFVRPQFPDRRGDTGYTPTGMRAAQGFGLDVYSDGEQIVPTARVTQIPENGDITFSGSKVVAPRLQYVALSDSSEFQYTARSHEMVSKHTMGTRADRTMGEQTAQLAFASNLLWWISRGGVLLYERVSGTVLAGAAVPINGPDGRNGSGFTIAAPIAMQNPAAGVNSTLILWGTALAPTFTQYGNTVAGWVLQYRQGVALPANSVLPPGSYFDTRVINALLTVAEIGSYYTNVIRQAGRGFLPIF